MLKKPDKNLKFNSGNSTGRLTTIESNATQR